MVIIAAGKNIIVITVATNLSLLIPKAAFRMLPFFVCKNLQSQFYLSFFIDIKYRIISKNIDI